MDDEAQVLLVHAQPKGVGGDHDARLAAVHERGLHLVALARAHPAVVAAALHAVLGQEVGQGVDRLDRRGVDDAAAGLAVEQAEQGGLLAPLAPGGEHVVAEVRAAEADVDHRRVRDPELGQDVVLDPGRRRRGERQHGRPAHRAHRVAQPEVGRAEVVPPLRDAVRLVDHEQRHPRARERLAEPGVTQALGRHVRHARAAAREALEGGVLVARRERGVEPHHLEPELGQLVVLILHQRDERRDDQRDAVELEGGELVAERLAAAGRHDRQRIDAGDHVADGQALAGTEVADAEPAPAERQHALLDAAVVGDRRRDGRIDVDAPGHELANIP